MHTLPIMLSYADQAPAAIANSIEDGLITRRQARILALMARSCGHLSVYKVGSKLHARTDTGRHVILTRAGAIRYP